MEYEIATFGAGCFWGVEAAFRKVPGVVRTRVGYTGGLMDQPTYEDVLTDRTGHVEAVEVIYDPTQISYEKLLTIFWFIHDPTQDMRQGNDVGIQYRSVIFYHTNEQKRLAEASKFAAQKNYNRPITTTIEPAEKFWPAEDYHQRYLEKNPGGYCHVPLDKVKKFVTDLIKER